MKSLINSEIAKRVSKDKGFKAFEQISRFTLLSESFKVGRELSGKQEVKRKTVAEMYSKEIEAMYR